MIAGALKKAAADTWDELFYLVLINMIWCVGTLLILPWPLVTFGLFFVVHDIGAGKSVKLSTFFAYAHRLWKPAYLWGGVNAAVVLVLWLNTAFYSGATSRWMAILQMMMIALAVFWGVLQLITLPLYPHLETPSLNLALRNALILIGRYPAAVLVLLALIVLFGALSTFFPPIHFLLTFALIAVFTSRIVEALVAKEIKRQSTGDI